MSKQMIVAPSLLSADPMSFGRDAAQMEELGADWLHVDVMDGHFVPNLTFGLPFIKSLKKKSKLPLDVHIMISNPDLAAKDYVEAGADMLTFHLEAATHPHRIIQEIKNKGAKAGVSINPGTSETLLYPLLKDLDLILLMSVNPGFGGQSFIPNVLGKIRNLRQEMKHQGITDLNIEIDGGINSETVKLVAEAGATAVVAGSYIFSSQDREQAIKSLKVPTK